MSGDYVVAAVLGLAAAAMLIGARLRDRGLPQLQANLRLLDGDREVCQWTAQTGTGHFVVTFLAEGGAADGDWEVEWTRPDGRTTLHYGFPTMRAAQSWIADR